MGPKHARVAMIATTYTGSLFALLEDGSIWERVRGGNNAIGEGQYKWERTPHPFDISTEGDAELASWR